MQALVGIDPRADVEVVEYPELQQLAFYGDTDGEWIAGDRANAMLDAEAHA